jgi:hypothetical protein
VKERHGSALARRRLAVVGSSIPIQRVVLDPSNEEDIRYERSGTVWRR